MKKRIPSLTGFWDRILLTSSKKDARLVISDAVNEDEAITKRQLDTVSSSITSIGNRVTTLESAIHAKVLEAWDDDSEISSSGSGEQTLFSYLIPTTVLTVVKQTIEIEVWGTVGNTGSTTTLSLRLGTTIGNGTDIVLVSDIPANALQRQFHLKAKITYFGNNFGDSNSIRYDGLSSITQSAGGGVFTYGNSSQLINSNTNAFGPMTNKYISFVVSGGGTTLTTKVNDYIIKYIPVV